MWCGVSLLVIMVMVDTSPTDRLNGEAASLHLPDKKLTRCGFHVKKKEIPRHLSTFYVVGRSCPWKKMEVNISLMSSVLWIFAEDNLYLFSRRLRHLA